MVSLRTLVAAAASTLCLAGVNAMYWPVSEPSSSHPWVVGQPASIVWVTGGDTGIMAFDIQLHNSNKTIMEGFVPIAQQVPLKKWSSGSNKGRYGGELGVDLTNTQIPTGNDFILIFLNTGSGIVYGRSERFQILQSSDQPSNWTTAVNPSGAPATTATLTNAPNPTQQYPLTLDGQYSSVVPTSIAGGAGSGH